MEWVASTLTLPRNVVYPALLPLMGTPRLPVVDRTDAPADLNGLVRFAERRNLVSARVPSHFNWPLRYVEPYKVFNPFSDAGGLNSNYCPGRRGFWIYSAILKCIHTRTVHRGRQRVENCRSVQCTEASIEGINLFVIISTNLYEYSGSLNECSSWLSYVVNPSR